MCHWQHAAQKRLTYFIARHFLKERLAASSGVSALAHDVNNTAISRYKINLDFIGIILMGQK
jgi:hypothetical protein